MKIRGAERKKEVQEKMAYPLIISVKIDIN